MITSTTLAIKPAKKAPEPAHKRPITSHDLPDPKTDGAPGGGKRRPPITAAEADRGGGQ